MFLRNDSVLLLRILSMVLSRVNKLLRSIFFFIHTRFNTLMGLCEIYIFAVNMTSACIPFLVISVYKEIHQLLKPLYKPNNLCFPLYIPCDILMKQPSGGTGVPLYRPPSYQKLSQDEFREVCTSFVDRSHIRTHPRSLLPFVESPCVPTPARRGSHHMSRLP
jgi:hypothetical protein